MTLKEAAAKALADHYAEKRDRIAAMAQKALETLFRGPFDLDPVVAVNPDDIKIDYVAYSGSGRALYTVEGITSMVEVGDGVSEWETNSPSYTVWMLPPRQWMCEWGHTDEPQQHHSGPIRSLADVGRLLEAFEPFYL